jgi:hypothetical protein
MSNQEKMAELADKIFAYKQKLSAFKKMHEDLISGLEEKLHALMTEGKCETITGGKAIARMKPKKTVVVEDWSALQEFVIRHRAFDLLQKRITESAIIARHDSGETVSGCKIDSKQVLSILELKE